MGGLPPSRVGDTAQGRVTAAREDVTTSSLCLATAFSTSCRRRARRRFTAEGATWEGGVGTTACGLRGPRTAGPASFRRSPALLPRSTSLGGAAGPPGLGRRGLLDTDRGRDRGDLVREGDADAEREREQVFERERERAECGRRRRCHTVPPLPWTSTPVPAGSFTSTPTPTPAPALASLPASVVRRAGFSSTSRTRSTRSSQQAEPTPPSLPVAVARGDADGASLAPVGKDPLQCPCMVLGLPGANADMGREGGDVLRRLGPGPPAAGTRGSQPLNLRVPDEASRDRGMQASAAITSTAVSLLERCTS